VGVIASAAEVGTIGEQVASKQSYL